MFEMRTLKKYLVQLCATRDLPSPQPRIAFSQFVASPPAKERCCPRGSSSGGEKCHQPTLCHRAEARAKTRGAPFAASGVWPNPSLKPDRPRQAAWATWRAGLCCTTPPKRLAARVGLSSNVRRQNRGVWFRCQVSAFGVN